MPNKKTKKEEDLSRKLFNACRRNETITDIISSEDSHQKWNHERELAITGDSALSISELDVLKVFLDSPISAIRQFLEIKSFLNRNKLFSFIFDKAQTP